MILVSKTLGDLFKIGSSKRVLKADWKTSGVPFYRGREITALSKFGYIDNDLFISEEYFSELSEKKGVPSAGDILITAIGTIGNTYIVKENDKFYFKDASVLWLSEGRDIDSKFMDYWFKSEDFFKQLDIGNGATVDTLSISKLKSLEITPPPLPIQKQIIEKLDAAFADIDKAISATEKNIENAEAIFKKFTDDLFLSVVGEKKTLKDVTTALTCGVAKRPNYIDKGIPFLSARNVKNGKMKWVNYKFISTDAHLQLTKYNKPELGDILYSRVGAGFGDAAIVDKNIEFSIFVSLTLIKPGSELYNKYLCHYLNSSAIKELAASSISGTGVGNLNVGAVRKFPISLPSFEDQQKVVIKIDAFLKKTNEYRKAQENKLSLLKKLKASILIQAFSGELTKDAA